MSDFSKIFAEYVWEYSKEWKIPFSCVYTTWMTMGSFSAPKVAVQLILKFEKVFIKEFNQVFD